MCHVTEYKEKECREYFIACLPNLLAEKDTTKIHVIQQKLFQDTKKKNLGHPNIQCRKL